MESEAAQVLKEHGKDSPGWQTSLKWLRWPHLSLAGVPGWVSAPDLEINPLPYKGGKDKMLHYKKTKNKTQQLWGGHGNLENLRAKGPSPPTNRLTLMAKACA